MWRSYVLYPFIHIGSLLITIFIMVQSAKEFPTMMMGSYNLSMQQLFQANKKVPPQVVSDDSCIELGGWS